MSNRVVPLKPAGGDAPDGKEGKRVVKAITEAQFFALMKKVKALTSSMSTDRATLGGHIADAVENKYLHKGAFGIFRRLDSMDPYKRAELLFHFDLYRERAKWDDSIEQDMFPDRNEAAE